MARESIISEIKVSFDGSEFGKRLYRDAKAKIQKPLSPSMVELDIFLKAIENLESPRREEAFVNFCIKNSKFASTLASRAA